MRAVTQAGITAKSDLGDTRRFDQVRCYITKQSVMLLNATALSVGAGGTALLGFVYWWLAARSFPAQAVGCAAAAISMMNFLAQLGELGMGTLLMGEVPKRPENGPALISATLLTVVISMFAVGGACFVVGSWTSLDLGDVTSSSAGWLAFVAGLALTGFTLVLDQAYIGLLRSSMQMCRTMTFATVKLVLLTAIVLSSGNAGELGIFSSWIGGQLCSIAVLCAVCVYGGGRVWHRPRVGLLRPLLGTVLQHHMLSVVIQAPGLLLPFIVAVTLSAQTNAAFYAAWTLVNVVLLVPASLTSAMYSVSAGDTTILRSRLKMSLSLSFLMCLITGVVLYTRSGPILALFSPIYPAIAGPSLALLGFGTFAVMLKYHYVVVQRLRYRMVEASLILGMGGLLEIAAAIGGAHMGNLLGLAEGWLIAVFVEAAVLAPTVWRAMRHGISAKNGDRRPNKVRNDAVYTIGAADAQSGAA